MTILNELRASGGTDVIIPVIELDADSMHESILICNGFQDMTVRLESGQTRQAYATGMDVALPKKDATGAQNLRFAIANVRGQAVKMIRDAERDQIEIRLIYRSYLASDLSAPAENPLHMIARSVTIKGDTVDIVAGFFDLIDTQFPRDVYTSEFAPGIKYLD